MSTRTCYENTPSGRWQTVAGDCLRWFNPAYPIEDAEMRPITKISVFGVRLAMIVLGFYWLAMFVGTHLPASQHITPHVNDKVKHFSAFFGLGAMLCYVTNSPRWFLRFFSIGLLGMVYAALDEFTQGFVPGRVPDVADFVADSIGLWCAIVIYMVGKFVVERWMVAPSQLS